VEQVQSSKKKKNKKKQVARARLDSSDASVENLEDLGISKKQRKKKEALAKKQQQPSTSENGAADQEVDGADVDGEGDEDGSEEQLAAKPASKSKGKKAKAARKAEKSEKKTTADEDAGAEVDSNGEEGDGEDQLAAKSASKSKGKKAKAARQAEKFSVVDEDVVSSFSRIYFSIFLSIYLQDVENTCLTCKSVFPTRNKLFDHFKKSGHSVPLSNLPPETKKDKKRRK
jgi:DnaJ homolog subfamily A member 5